MNFTGIDILIKDSIPTDLLLSALSQAFGINKTEIQIVSSCEYLRNGSKLSCTKTSLMGAFSIHLSVNGHLDVEVRSDVFELVGAFSNCIQSKVLIPKDGCNPFLFWEIDKFHIEEVSFDEESRQPENEIDGATVLEWAWSGEKSFGYILGEGSSTKTEVYGFAICKYTNSEEYYRFSCDQNWNVKNDMVYDSIEDAKLQIPINYCVENIKWEAKLSKRSP